MVAMLLLLLLALAAGARAAPGRCRCAAALPSALVATCGPRAALTRPLLASCGPSPAQALSLRVRRAPNASAAPAFAPGALAGLPRLRAVSLAGLGLSALPGDLLSAQSASLVSLNLSGNRLTELPDALLPPMRRLALLDLSGNRLSALPAGAPSRWPRVDLRLARNPLPPCWTLEEGAPVLRDAWRCRGKARRVEASFMGEALLSAPLPALGRGERVVWAAPQGGHFAYANGSGWALRFPSHLRPSWVGVDPPGANSTLRIDGVRPFFAGEWACLLVAPGPSPEVTEAARVELVCRTYVRAVYHWSLVFSAACTAAMLIAGLLSALTRLLWATRCFTRKVHVISALSLHDLQYSPRLAQQRLRILRSVELHADGASSCCSEGDFPASSWLPPHRQPSADLFAHGGAVSSAVSSASTSAATSEDEQSVLSAGDDSEAGEADGLRQRVDELRQRLRRDMVRRVDTVRSRMRESRHSVEESTSRVMRHLRSGGSVAASKMRTGFCHSLESVKCQVRTVAEFCGASSGGLGQTVSVATLDTDVDSRTTKEVYITEVTAV